MSAHLSPSPKLRFFGKDGKPLAGGKLITYLSGTSDTLATWADAGMNANNPVEIELDANGEPSYNGNSVLVYLEDGISYKFRWFDKNGGFVDEADPVQNGFGAGGGEGGLTPQDIKPLVLRKFGKNIGTYSPLSGKTVDIPESVVVVTEQDENLYGTIAQLLADSRTPVLVKSDSDPDQQGITRDFYYYPTARTGADSDYSFLGHNGEKIEVATVHEDNSVDYVALTMDDVVWIRLGVGGSDVGHELTKVTAAVNEGKIPIVEFTKSSNEVVYAQLSEKNSGGFTFLGVENSGALLDVIRIVGNNNTTIRSINLQSGNMLVLDYDPDDTDAYDLITDALANGRLVVVDGFGSRYYYDGEGNDAYQFKTFTHPLGSFVTYVEVTPDGMSNESYWLTLRKESYNASDVIVEGNIDHSVAVNTVVEIDFENVQFTGSMQFETLYSVNAPAKSVVILKNFVPATNGTSILLYRDNNTPYSLTSDSLQTLFDSGDYVIDFNGDVAQISMLNSSKYKMKAIGTQDFVFSFPTATFNTQTNYRYVLDDWDTAWAIQRIFINPPRGYNVNVVVRFMNVDTSVQAGMEIVVTGCTKIGDSLDHILNGRSYELTIVGTGWYLAEIYNTNANYVTDDEMKAALTALKSRVIYTIPLGSVGRIEQIKLDANGSDISLHATLFNPNMDQDLNSDSNIVVNFGSSGNNFSGSEFILFAIYEFDRINGVWNWIANTAAIENTGANVSGIQHYSLAYRDANKMKLESRHLYLFVCAGRKNTVEIMGNQLDANLNMSSSSLALASGKQNNSGYTGAANFGTDFATIDLTTFSESQANSRAGNQQAARVFASITNLQNLP